MIKVQKYSILQSLLSWVMNEEENFLTIETLASLIETKVSGIQKGEIKIEMLEQLLDDVKQLQERLIIIKYESMIKLTEINVDKSKPENTSPISYQSDDEPSIFDDKGEEVPENQISLIDVIEEIYEEKAHSEPMDLFGSIGQLIEIIDEKPSVKVDKIAIEKTVEVKEIVEETEEVLGKKTLGEKIKNKAIKSIPKSIKLNARIGMIKQLFSGDSEKYKAAIEDLNAAENGPDAKTKLNSYLEEHDWDSENEWFELLRQLVDRRYI
ncbi:MAG: hypothetical protein ACI8YO_000465 [Gammaproteobacteria bacterium]